MKTRAFYVLLSVSPIAILFVFLLSGKVIYNNTPSYPMGLYLVEKKRLMLKVILYLFAWMTIEILYPKTKATLRNQLSIAKMDLHH